MKTSTIIGILVVAVVVIGGVIWYASGKSSSEATEYGTGGSAPAQAPAQSGDIASTSAAPAQTNTITYDGTSFSPASLTVRVGDTVTFVDAGSDPMWVASAVHPVHSGYDGTTLAEHCAASYTGPAPFDECAASSKNYSFTFTKAGTWPFHDHENASAFGKIIVK